ncbi:AbrB/MazE/SpoVT family DNA-binding domain-containing protein [Peribacillus cavernae]|nr:AbrB/MazE/SpoVT family DNA-binding domain-containing protein [Peribacillus cavernae]MDQ0219231.1 putative addiction module antidote [Peribacillus cavernae]
MEKEKKFIRKVNQQGNSLSVGIPKEVAECMNIGKGEELEVIFNEETNELKMKKLAKLPEGVRPEVLEALHSVMGQYKAALKNLQDR